MISFANLLYVLLTYLIESCSYKLNVVYVQRKKHSIWYTTAKSEVHTFKHKNRRKSLRDIFVYHFLFYIYLFVAQFLIFKPLSYCFEETIGFEAKASFASRPDLRLIRRYNEPGDITKEF